jgi:hypothetical protein
MVDFLAHVSLDCGSGLRLGLGSDSLGRPATQENLSHLFMLLPFSSDTARFQLCSTAIANIAGAPILRNTLRNLLRALSVPFSIYIE